MLNRAKIEKLQDKLDELRAHPDNSVVERAELTGMLKVIDMILDPKQTILNEMEEPVRLYPYL